MNRQIKILGLLAYVLFVFVGCKSTKVVELGKLNMISNRNVDSKTEYVLIKNYAGSDKNEIKKALKKQKLQQWMLLLTKPLETLLVVIF
jgi:hypothetical protein